MRTQTPRHHMMSACSRWTREALFALMLCALLTSGCAATPTSPSAALKFKPALSIVVMGASDAWGVGTRDPDRLNWPTLLAAELPQPTHLINLGEPAATLAQAQRSELPVVLDERPDIAVVWLAVNDIIDKVPLSAYSSELRQTLTAIHQQTPQTRVFVGNVPDLTQIPYFASWDSSTLRAEISAWNTAIEHACAMLGATLVDIHSAWGQPGRHPDYLSYDGLHPSDRGAEALASVFRAAITQSLRKSP